MPELEAQVERLQLGGFVRFEPFLDDAALRGAAGERSVYITASEHEGFGLSVVEAMAAGLIVICRRMAPLDSFIEHGRSGWLLDFDGAAADFERVSCLLSCDPKRLAEVSAAARMAASVHDWAVAIPRFVGFYREALSGQAGQRVGRPV
jgi:alpha-1,3-mannosyltransferase